jgi:hypothetical protein
MGDLHRIVKAKNKKRSDPEFEYLLTTNPEKLSRKLSPFFTRPVYAYTKAEVGGHKTWRTEHTTNS